MENVKETVLEIETYDCSADGGNSTIKTLVEGEQYLSIPNVVASREKLDYKMSPNLKESKTGVNRLDVSVSRKFGEENSNESSYLLGALAEQFKGLATPRQAGDKCNDSQLCSNMLASVAYSILKYKIVKGKELNENENVKVRLSTGLPFSEWENEGKQELFKNNLHGKHKIKFNNPFFVDMLGVETITLDVKDVIVNIEGESSLTPVLRLKFKDMDLRSLDGKIISVIDIGAGTTEVVTKEFQIEYDEEDDEFNVDLSQANVTAGTVGHLSKGLAVGISDIYDNVIKDVKKNSDLDTISRRDIEIALGKRGVRDGQAGWLLGKDINIMESFERHATALGADLARTTYEIYKKGNVRLNIYKIFVTGGGSHIKALVDSFKSTMAEQGIKIELIESLDEPNPVYSNVIGYYLKLKDSSNSSEKKTSNGVA